MAAFATSSPLLATPCRSLSHRRRCPRRVVVRRAVLSRVTPRASTSDADAIAALSADDFLERIRGATALYSADALSNSDGVPERVNALLPLARSDPNSQVRFVALGALAAQPRDALSPELLAAILDVCRDVLTADKEPNCRCSAADTITALRLKDGFDDLVAAFNSEGADWMLKLSVVAGLGEMNHDRSYDFLASIVDPEGKEYASASAEPLVYATAVGALGDLGDLRALPLVSELAKNADDETVRERAAVAVEMLEKAAA